MVRLRVSIPQVDPTVMDVPEVCPYEDCDGECFTPHRQHCEKPLRDTEYDKINATRQCTHSERTHRLVAERSYRITHYQIAQAPLSKTALKQHLAQNSPGLADAPSLSPDICLLSATTTHWLDALGNRHPVAALDHRLVR